MNQVVAVHFTADQLVERWNGIVVKGTLCNWRSGKNKKGPPFVKIGGRVLYPIAGVLEWERKNMHAANDNQPEQAISA
jgi:hypothetical protein